MTGDGSTGRILGGWTIRRSGDTVCGMHRARGDEGRGFLGSSLKPRSMVCQWFGLKTTEMIFSGLASKPVAMVFFGLALKPVVTVFSGLTSKLVATVFSGLASKPVVLVSSGLPSNPVVGFLVEPQNQGGAWFPGFGLKTSSYGFVIWP
jgi:hypothetical protein